MSIPLQRVARVVVAGEWYSVQLGTFEIVEMAFEDTDGEVRHPPLDTLAYRFLTTNKDEYYGPLASIDLIKLLDI